MKNRFMILVVLVLFLGCNEQSPVTPEGTSPVTALSKKRGGRDKCKDVDCFTARADLSLVIDSGQQVVDNLGNLHIAGQTQEGPITGDIEGTIRIEFDAVLDLATFGGIAFAYLTITTEEGIWEGTSGVEVDALISSGPFELEGTGRLAGRRIIGTLKEDTNAGPDPDVFTLEGVMIRGRRGR